MNELDKKVVLKVRGLTKRFNEGRMDLTVLHGVNLDVYAGETLAIVGSSGSGKSTLLHLMGGLDAPTAGSVELLGQNIAQVDAAEQGRLRNKHLARKCIDLGGREISGAQRTLHACQFLGLHEIHKGIDGARNIRIAAPKIHLLNDANQRMNGGAVTRQLHLGCHIVCRRLPAPCRQGIPLHPRILDARTKAVIVMVQIQLLQRLL